VGIRPEEFLYVFRLRKRYLNFQRRKALLTPAKEKSLEKQYSCPTAVGSNWVQQQLETLTDCTG
jgi:hypothetical protein